MAKIITHRQYTATPSDSNTPLPPPIPSIKFTKLCIHSRPFCLFYQHLNKYPWPMPTCNKYTHWATASNSQTNYNFWIEISWTFLVLRCVLLTWVEPHLTQSYCFTLLLSSTFTLNIPSISKYWIPSIISRNAFVAQLCPEKRYFILHSSTCDP